MCGRSNVGHTEETKQRRLWHIAALSNAVCMHDYHLPDAEGPPHHTAACAKIVGANPDTGEKGHTICSNGYPMSLIARHNEERIEHDENRGHLFHLRLARNCPTTVGGNKNIRFISGSNEATKVITHRKGATDYVAKYQTDGGKAGGGEKDIQRQFVSVLDKMAKKDKLFGDSLSPSFNQIMGGDKNKNSV